MSTEKGMEAIVERIQKILALGRRGGTEAEAAAAMAKAQELLAEHNLTLAQVESAQQGTARREELAAAGGSSMRWTRRRYTGWCGRRSSRWEL